MAACVRQLLHVEPLLAKVLPIDPVTANTVRSVANSVFSVVSPTPIENPVLVAVSAPALAQLGLDTDTPTLIKDPRFLALMSGSTVPPESTPLAQCYCGHQFGSFAGQLGDGAAILVAEVPATASTPRLELQLKGAGLTPYSRTADGRKVLRSSIREFLCSEAMHGLGIPTTRAAALVTSDSTVVRDPHYNGRARAERCSVVARVAESFFRFGSFETVLVEGHGSDRHGPSPGNTALARQLFDFVAVQHFGATPMTTGSHSLGSTTDAECSAARKNQVRRVVAEVVQRTARLVAQWQCVGFVHGVLNTDNMSVLGVTIDYGPYGFMEYFDPDMVPNTSDDSGLYRYSNQPQRCKWNCDRLAEALAYVEAGGEEREAFATELKTTIVGPTFDTVFEASMNELISKKLGLPTPLSSTAVVATVRTRLFDVLAATAADMTKAFLALQESFDVVRGNKDEPIDAIAVRCLPLLLETVPPRALQLRKLKQSAFQLRRSASQATMDERQLAGIERLCQEEPDKAVDAFGADAATVLHIVAQQRQKREALLKAKAKVETLESQTDEAYLAAAGGAFGSLLEQLIPLWREADRNDHEEATSRRKVMRGSNPRFVLRQWVAQQAIEAAEERNDFATTQKLVDRLLRPFDVDSLDDSEQFATPPPNAAELCVSCSS